MTGPVETRELSMGRVQREWSSLQMPVLGLCWAACGVRLGLCPTALATSPGEQLPCLQLLQMLRSTTPEAEP